MTGLVLVVSLWVGLAVIKGAVITYSVKASADLAHPVRVAQLRKPGNEAEKRKVK